MYFEERLGWISSGLLFFAGIFVLLGIFMCIVADHSPQFYYLGNAGEHNRFGYCVQIHQEWASNPTVFCSDDVEKSLQVVFEANARLQREKIRGK